MFQSNSPSTRYTWVNIFLTTFLITSVTTIASMAITLFVIGAFITRFLPAVIITATVLPVFLTAIVTIFLTIRQQKLTNINLHLTDLAFTDPLLDCLNRRGFEAVAETALASANPQNPCSLLLIDADKFKSVNDRYGHESGDQALHLIIVAIKASIRDHDEIGRLGGDEFCVLLPGTNGVSAKAIALRIARDVTQLRFVPADTPHLLTVSIGGTTTHAPAQLEDKFRTADQNLYAAKKNGRNSVNFGEKMAGDNTFPTTDNLRETG